MDLSKLRVFGPGVSSDVRIEQRTSFTIDSRQIGSNDVEVEIMDPKGEILPVELDENDNGLVICNYKPQFCGTHRVVFIYSYRS